MRVKLWRDGNQRMAQQRNRGQEFTDDRRHRRRRRGGHFEVSYKTNERTRMKLNLYCCVCRSTRINFSSNESAHIKTTDSAATQLQLQLQLRLQSRRARARERAAATATAAAVPAIDRERRVESRERSGCIRVSRSWQNVSAL